MPSVLAGYLVALEAAFLLLHQPMQLGIVLDIG